MSVVLIGPMAKRDLANIYNYIAVESNRDRAIIFLSKIRQKAKAMATHPGMGQRHDLLQAGIRSFPVGNYILYYEEIQSGVLVHRVLHGARDIPSAFWEEE